MNHQQSVRLFPLLVSCLIGVVLGGLVAKQTLLDVVYMDVGTRWCLYGEYLSLDHYHKSDAPQKSFVTINGQRVTVYSPCVYGSQ